MVKINTLKAGTIKAENTGKSNKVLNIYVPNKDCMVYTLGAGESMEITTLSAGESFFYLSQAKDELSVTLA